MTLNKGFYTAALNMICLYLHIIFEPEPEGRILTHDQGAAVNYSSLLSALHSHYIKLPERL